MKTLDELIEFCWTFRGENWRKYWNMIPLLQELSDIVGMDDLKKEIVNMIVYYGGDNQDEKEENLMHTVLYGPPGVGKTTIAHILAKIYTLLGYLSKGHVIKAGREDFIGKFIGHSESKTTELLEEAKGGVLFIDEVYSMGHSDKTDSFSKAAVDILNEFLTKNKKDFICIIAGYEQDIKNNFFSINKGLQRRFPWQFRIEGYSNEELYSMFELMLQKTSYKLIEKEKIKKWFISNQLKFEHFGGDIETILLKCKMTSSHRRFGTDEEKIISFQDFKNAIEMFKYHKNNNDNLSPPMNLYI